MVHTHTITSLRHLNIFIPNIIYFFDDAIIKPIKICSLKHTFHFHSLFPNINVSHSHKILLFFYWNDKLWTFLCFIHADMPHSLHFTRAFNESIESKYDAFVVAWWWWWSYCSMPMGKLSRMHNINGRKRLNFIE